MEQVLRKHHLDDTLSINPKQTNNAWYLKLESENSRTSDGDSESITSLQGKETDLAQDTPDTDTKSEYNSSSSDDEVYEVEYEVASLSGDDNPFREDPSSGSDEMLMGAAIAAAAAICDSTMEAWITDVEDSDSSLDETGLSQTEFLKCIQCNSQNDNPCYRYCEKCFQARKNLFPPRPRKNRPRKEKNKVTQSVALAALRSCLNGLSQDSGIGSSQEVGGLGLDKIVVPKHLSEKLKKPSTSSSTITRKPSSTITRKPSSTITRKPSSTITRKRTISNGSDSLFSDTDVESSKRRKVSKDQSSKSEESTSTINVRESNVNDHLGTSSKELSDIKSETSKESSEEKNQGSDVHSSLKIIHDSTKDIEVSNNIAGNKDPRQVSWKELCIICNEYPQNSMFVHNNTGHMCCCYRCAIQAWHTTKSCPICKMKIQKVVKVFLYSS